MIRSAGSRSWPPRMFPSSTWPSKKMRMTSLATLISACERLKGPSPQLDLVIEKYFSDWEQLWVSQFRHRKTGEVIHTPYRVPPAYTGSLHAAIALTGQLLPGWQWGLHPYAGSRRAYVVEDNPTRLVPVVADHACTAIALVMATLRACLLEKEIGTSIVPVSKSFRKAG